MKQKVLDFIKNHKKWVVGVLVLVGVFLFGYYEGRHHQIPAQIETHVITDTVSTQLLQESLKREESLKQQLAIAQKTITDLKVIRVVTTHEVKHKDGSETIDTTTKTDTTKTVDNTVDTHQTTTDVTKVVDNTTSNVTTTTHTDSHTLITPITKPNWYLGASAGINFRNINDPGTPAWLKTGPVFLGVEAKRRLFDMGNASMWAGANLDTTLRFQITAGVTW